MIRRHHSGFSSAAVPMLTRAQPVASAAASESSSRMPPDSSTLTSSLEVTSASSAWLEPRPNAASRSTRWIHSAPALCQAMAASYGAPYDVSVPASPWTRRTACPPATSTAGNRTRDIFLGPPVEGERDEHRDEEGRQREHGQPLHPRGEIDPGHHLDEQERHQHDGVLLAAPAREHAAGAPGTARQEPGQCGQPPAA